MKSFVFALFVLLVMVSSVAATETFPNWATSLVAVPGVSLGPIQIGMTRNMVFNRLGFPSEIERKDSARCGPNCVDVYWKYDLPNETVFVVSWTLRPNGPPEEQTGVDYLYTDSSRATVGGLVPKQSTLKDAIQRYGLWEEHYRQSFWWAQRGLRLVFGGDDVLEAISIHQRE